LGESTASFLRVQKTWQQPVEIDAFPTRKRMSVSQFVEVRTPFQSLSPPLLFFSPLDQTYRACR
jgi:hypothetical protein